MLSLPFIQGRFPVGATTFATPVRPVRSVGTARLKQPYASRPSESADLALQLEEVAFTAYYPADTSGDPPRGIDWLVRPLRDSLLGLSAYSGISMWLLWPAVYLFGSLIKIPVYGNAPLLHPEKARVGTEKQWPLVIFSHGLGGSRTTYSQFCSRIAASGKIVLALEHRDGTGMACRPRSWDADNKILRRSIVYLRETDISWGNAGPPEAYPKPLRGEQLAFRHHEIYTAYQAFQRFVGGNPHVELETIDGSSFDRTSWTSTSSCGNSVVRCCEDVILTGHSFGGATALSLLATEPSKDYKRIPISKVVILDPWLEPLPVPGPAPYLTPSGSDAELRNVDTTVQASLERNAIGSDINSLPKPSSQSPKMLVINSEAFTLWKDHFTRLQDIVATWEPQGHRIMTLVGSEHISFSDFPILPGIRSKHAMTIFDTICQLSLAFIHDGLDEALKEDVPTTQMSIEIIGKKPDGRPKRKLIGDVGDVIVS